MAREADEAGGRCFATSRSISLGRSFKIAFLEGPGGATRVGVLVGEDIVVKAI